MTNRWTRESTLAASADACREENLMKTWTAPFLAVLILGLAAPVAAFDVGGALGLGAKDSGSDAELGEMTARLTYMVANCDSGVTTSDVTNQVASYGLKKYGKKPDMEKVGEAAGVKAAQIALVRPSCEELAKEWKAIGGK